VLKGQLRDAWLTYAESACQLACRHSLEQPRDECMPLGGQFSDLDLQVRDLLS
jgi:hypothetical protein